MLNNQQKCLPSLINHFFFVGTVLELSLLESKRLQFTSALVFIGSCSRVSSRVAFFVEVTQQLLQKLPWSPSVCYEKLAASEVCEKPRQ